MAHTNKISIVLLLTCYPALQTPTIDNEALSLNQFGNKEMRDKSGGAPDLRSSKNVMYNLQNELNSKWPTGKISYYTNVSSYDFFIAYKLRMIMNMIETVSCIEFEALMVIPNATSDLNWIHFMNPRKERECVHNVDFSQKEIVVVLGYDCLSEVEILHSLMHGIGFRDEVTHPHRDKYIRVMWNNIQPAYKNLYYLRHEDKTAALVEYDPLSVMHFADRDYTIDGRPTVEPVVGGLSISPTRGLSQLDKLKLNLYFSYACNKREVKKILKTCKNTLHEEIDSKKNKDELDKSTEVKIETFANVSKETTSEEDKNVLAGKADSSAEDGVNNNAHAVSDTYTESEASAYSSVGVSYATSLSSEYTSAATDDIGLNSKVNNSAGVDSSAGAAGIGDKGTSENDSAGADNGANDESNPEEGDHTPLSGMADYGASGDDNAIADDDASDESNPGANGGTTENKDPVADSSAGADGDIILIGLADKDTGGDGNAGADGGSDNDKGSGSGDGTSVDGGYGANSGTNSEADKTEEGANSRRHSK